MELREARAEGLAAGWDGRDGGGGSAGSWDRGNGRDRGDGGEAQGGPVHGAWELPARLHLHFLSQAPARSLEGFGKIHVFQDITPKENYSTCICVQITVWKNLSQDPISHCHFKGRFEFRSFKEM